MARQEAGDVIRRYLQDAIAAEKSFEAQLRAFANDAKDTNETETQTLFEQHADETRRQHERLTARLDALGGGPSAVKSLFATLFGAAPKAAQLGHDDAEKTSQDLMMAYAVEHSEIAMYESLASAASAAGDLETERLAREIQQEERRAAEKVWPLIAPCARRAFARVTGGAYARVA